MVTYPNLNHLKYFADAVELGSISAAAKRNYVTHPAISRAITVLENHLNVQLLNHQKKSFQVTETGLKVAEQAKALLAAAAQFNALDLDAPGASPDKLSIAISRSLGPRYLGPTLNETLRRFPTAKMHVQFGTTNGIVESVARGTVDIGITIGTQSMPGLKQTALRSGKFVLIGPSSSAHRLRQLQEAKNFILTEPRRETELLKREFYRKFKTPLPFHCEVSSWDAIAHLVGEGLGIGLVPDLILSDPKRANIQIIPTPWFSSEYRVFVHHSRVSSANLVVRAALRHLAPQGE